jgi:hypothetical protein
LQISHVLAVRPIECGRGGDHDFGTSENEIVGAAGVQPERFQESRGPALQWRAMAAFAGRNWIRTGLLAAAVGFVPALAGAQAPPPQVSALAPENLAKPRPKRPFDLTGNWFIDNSPGIQGWLFGPATIPKLTPNAQKHRDAYLQAIKDGKVYRDDIGQCWPAGVPIIMTACGRSR